MRTQLTKITLAASIALAMAFTFGCSDDKDDPPNKYCVYSASGVDVSCYNLSETFTEAKCKEDGGSPRSDEPKLAWGKCTAYED